MNAEMLRALQKPLKEKYRNAPEAALIILRAEGRVGAGLTCKHETPDPAQRARDPDHALALRGKRSRTV
jgi:hypothetical protein